jgi:glycerol-3-phosphate O-acyltransferase/dihydroxyacetone phosphate acyltransferase
MVIISNPRRFSPLMAESSFKRKIVGAAARALKASKFIYTKVVVI